MTDLFTQQDDQSQIAAYIPGETNKYKNLEELAKGAYEKDRHIKNVERENAELRASNLKLLDDNKTKASLEDYIDQITKSAAGPLPTSEGTNPKPNDVQPFDPQQIESLVQSKIREHEVSKTREQNAKSVVEVLKERYGHNYLDVLNKQTEELGLSKDTVNYLAETAPKAFFKTLGLEQAKTETFIAPPPRSPFFALKAKEEETWSYWQRMRKDNPTLYNNPKTQEQMMKAYQRLGSKFEDGDFLAYGQESAF